MSRDICLRCLATSHWWRGEDLNLRPSGYEPDELPDCSTPRRSVRSYMAGPLSATTPRRPGGATATCRRGPQGQSVWAAGGGGGGEFGSAAWGGGGGGGASAGAAVGAAAADSGASVRVPWADSWSCS